MTYISKSKRINSIEDGDTIECMNGPNNRWARAWKEYMPGGYDNETGEMDWSTGEVVYRYEGGCEMMPADYHANVDTLEQLEIYYIRDFADLRKWRHDGAW